MKHLYRSKEKIIAGVCGGISEYLNVDPVWIRLLFVLFALWNGMGIILYLISWIIIPEGKQKGKTKYDSGHVIVGIALIAVGLVVILERFFSWLDFKYVWPALLIVLGIYLLSRGNRK